jgi:hypothetical protein
MTGGDSPRGRRVGATAGDRLGRGAPADAPAATRRLDLRGVEPAGSAFDEP